MKREAGNLDLKREVSGQNERAGISAVPENLRNIVNFFLMSYFTMEQNKHDLF